MTVPSNILQIVKTYQEAELAFFQNLTCFVSTANTRFKEFNNLTANLGDSVSFVRPPRQRAVNGLVATFQGVEERVQTLTCDQSANVANAFTSQQFIFNIREYLDQFGKAAMYNLASIVDTNVALNAVTNTYRYFGSPSAPITTFGQLATMLAAFRNIGVPPGAIKVYLPDTAVPTIVNSGLNQFVLDRNEDQAMSWMIGNWNGVEFYQSNQLPTHTAGTLAEAGTTLTLVSTNDPTGAAITSLTFSGAGTNVNAVKENDLFTFQDNVGSLPNLRFPNWQSYSPSSQPVQFRATADAASSAGSVTISVSPVLVSQQTQNQNLNVALQAGMQVKGVGSHRAGLVVSDNALFVAMPMLDSQDPFPTGNAVDPDSGVSIRNYYGSLFGQNQKGYVHDCLWGSTLVPENAMRLIFPA